MHLQWTREQDAFRAELSGWLALNVPRRVANPDTAEGFAVLREWEQRLHRDGWSVVSWPKAYGGRGASPWQALIFDEEYWRAGAPERITDVGIFFLAPYLRDVGRHDQCDALLPRIASAAHVWCRGWSERGGSDPASIEMQGRRVERGWVLNGEKTWTVGGLFCTHMVLVARTEPGSMGTTGLTCFLVPLDISGINVCSSDGLVGAGEFADVGFRDVFLADDAIAGGVVLGTPGGASALRLTARDHGPNVVPRDRTRPVASRVMDLYRDSLPDGDPVLRDRLVRAWMRAEAQHLYTMSSITRSLDGRDVAAESSIRSAWASALEVELNETACAVLGDGAELAHEWSRGLRIALTNHAAVGETNILPTATGPKFLAHVGA